MLSRRAAGLVALTVLLLVPTSRPAGQASRPAPLPSKWVAGFHTEIAGEIISYPSAYPGQMRTLLTRATDGKMRIEWEAEAPPPGGPDEMVHFVWHAGVASGYGAHRFTLSVNGSPCVTFNSGRDVMDRDWSIGTACGGTLSFRTTRVGSFNELFGLMALSIPRRLALPAAGGRPRFAAVGEAAGSSDYYLVFAQPLAAFTRVVAEQALLKGGRRALRVEISHIGAEEPARVMSGKSVLWTGTLSPGYTALSLPAPRAAVKSVPVVVEAGSRTLSSTHVALAPVRKWEIHLLPHSHVDIGYSDPQPEVERKQWKNLRDGVELAKKTAGYPPNARFKWNVEGLWAVDSYLRQAPDGERAALVDAVKRGAIGLQANYTNILTGLASPEELARWTDAAREMRAVYGFAPMRSAMHTDIPGLSWTTVRALAEGGVRYFSSGPNYMPSLPDRGDRIGHTLHALGDRPFWWVSPSGQERVLFWMAGRGYSWFHGMNMGSIAKAGRTPILDYVRDLNDSGYQWTMVQVRYTIGGDNGPVDPELPEIVKTWNETFDSPTLVINTAEAMFAEFERRYGAKLPQQAGDMTPYWEDGAVSSAAEEADVRNSARRLVQAETLWCLRSVATFPVRDAADAWRNVLLWHEHTWGAADSISQPDRSDVVGQWNYKRQFATEAVKRSLELMAGATAAGSQPATSPAVNTSAGGRAASTATVADAASADVLVEVANTLSWPRTGVVFLAAELTSGRDMVVDARGRPVASQRMKDGRLAVLATSVPPLASIRLTIRPGEATAPKPGVTPTAESLGNGIVRVAIDPRTGDIRSLRSTMAAGRELVATAGDTGAAIRGFNRYLYVPGRDPAAAREPGAARVSVDESGPLVATLRVENDAVPGARSLVRRITLVAGEQAVRLEHAIDKEAVRDKESAHIAFPFNLPGATLRVDEGAAIVSIESDQLPGSCRDFIGVHSTVDVATATAGVALASLDAPLIQLGAITDERQDPKARVRTWRTKTAPGSALYAYLLNNYWHTNYKADQEGPLVFRFVVRPHAAGEGTLALRRFGAEQEQPLVAYRVIAATRPARAPLRVEGAGVVVSSIRAGGDRGGMVVRLYNGSSRAATARVVAIGRATAIRAELVPLAEGASRPPAKQPARRRAAARQPAAIPSAGLLMPPYATALVRVTVR